MEGSSEQMGGGSTANGAMMSCNTFELLIKSPIIERVFVRFNRQALAIGLRV
jgi:hypothetical protein